MAGLTSLPRRNNALILSGFGIVGLYPRQICVSCLGDLPLRRSRNCQACHGRYTFQPASGSRHVVPTGSRQPPDLRSIVRSQQVSTMHRRLNLADPQASFTPWQVAEPFRICRPPQVRALSSHRRLEVAAGFCSVVCHRYRCHLTNAPGVPLEEPRIFDVSMTSSAVASRARVI